MRKWPAPLSTGVQREDSWSISANDSFQFAVSHRNLPSCSLGTSNMSPRASVSQRNSGCGPGPLCHYLPPKKNAKQWLWLSGHWTNPNQSFAFGRLVRREIPTSRRAWDWQQAEGRRGVSRRPYSSGAGRLPANACLFLLLFSIPSSSANGLHYTHVPARSELAETMQFSPWELGPLLQIGGYANY